MYVFHSQVFYDDSGHKNFCDLETVGITSNRNSVSNWTSKFIANNIKFEDNWL